MADADLKKGIVKWFNVEKGFGFITPDDGTEDLFVHQTAINSEGFRTLADGEEVEYAVEQGNDGRAKACNVTGPGGQPVQGSSRGSYGGRGGDGGGGYNNGSRGGPPRGGGGGGCFKCGENGHMARDCEASDGGGGGGGGGGRYGSGGGGRYGGGGGGRYGGDGGGRYGGGGRFGGGGGGGRFGGGGGGGGSCYSCGEDGHFARDCSSSSR